MPRSFRVYQKKRGARRTGSKVLASAGEALFFAAILTIGAVVLFLLLKRVVVPEWRANHSFEETTCVVTRIHDPKEIPEDDGPVYVPMVEVTYVVDGKSYTSDAYDIAMKRDVKLVRLEDEDAARALVSHFKVGERYPCWYDPAEPETVVLVRGYTWWLWGLLLLPVAFIGIGGVGLSYAIAHWGKSAEHRAATQLRSPKFDPSGKPVPTTQEYPFIPGAANLTNSPGTTLAYRLPVDTRHSWRVFAATITCVAWNAIVLVFVIRSVQSFVRGAPDWQLVLFTLPFLIGGIALVYALIRQIAATAGPGPTHIEISDHPLVPGGAYELVLTQAGNLRVQSFRVTLVCEEEVSFYQGTDVRIERRRVGEEEVFSRENFEIPIGVPFQHRCELKMPDRVMHSFQGENNEVQWMLIVTIKTANRAPWERIFPVVVYPAAAELSTA